MKWTAFSFLFPFAFFYFLFYFFQVSFSGMYGLPIFCYTLVLTIPLALLAFWRSRTDAAPRFHVVCSRASDSDDDNDDVKGFWKLFLQGIAFLSAFGAMFAIYSCASETVQILYVMGLVMDCSNSFLGTTLLAWGNGVGDLLSNAALAIHGHQKMAFAACLGGPFFSKYMAIVVIILRP